MIAFVMNRSINAVCYEQVYLEKEQYPPYLNKSYCKVANAKQAQEKVRSLAGIF